MKRLRWLVKSWLDWYRWPALSANQRRLDGLAEGAGLIAALCVQGGKSTIMANQNLQEIGGLYALVAARQPRVVVEIGTAQGGTLYLWSRAAAAGATLISIDMPGEMGSVRPVNRRIYRRFGRQRGVTVHTIDADSHGPQAHARLQSLLAGRPIDFLFIDGDHSYAGVKADYEGYQRYLAPDALVALHDIKVSSPDGWIQVARFWDELRQAVARTQEIVATPPTFGIGVVWPGLI